jgi:hypothetical protein
MAGLTQINDASGGPCSKSAVSQSEEEAMALRQIRLELARNAEHPEGSARHGYAFVAPLTDDGRLDPDGWRESRADCTVRRFWAGEDDRDGHLVHHRGHHWAFHYAGHDAGMGEDDEEPIFRFDRHRFVAGEYVSITEHDGVQRTFRVAEVVPFEA